MEVCHSFHEGGASVKPHVKFVFPARESNLDRPCSPLYHGSRLGVLHTVRLNVVTDVQRVYKAQRNSVFNFMVM